MTTIPISRNAARIKGTSADLQEGDILTLFQLFYGMMLPSGNDAAFALAEYFGQILKNKKYTGNQDMFGNNSASPFASHPTLKYFLKEMNNNAAKLKMNDTHYDSPHGLKN